MLRVLRGHISKAKDDHTGKDNSSRGKNIGKVQVVGQDDARFATRFFKNVHIRQPLELLVKQMNRTYPCDKKETV